MGGTAVLSMTKSMSGSKDCFVSSMVTKAESPCRSTRFWVSELCMMSTAPDLRLFSRDWGSMIGLKVIWSR